MGIPTFVMPLGLPMIRKVFSRAVMRNIGFSVFALFSATIVAFLSFISSELAIAVFALSSVAFIVMLERYRRSHWESSVDFRFKHMRGKQEAIEREVVRHRNHLDDIAKNYNRDAVSFKTIAQEAQDIQKPKPLTRSAVMDCAKEEITQRKAPTITVIEDKNSLSDMVVEELTGHALKNRRIDVFMQPIVRLPQRQRKFYEVFSRVRAKPGVYIPASRYLEIAKKNDQLQDIDTLLLAQCLDIVRLGAHHDHAPSFFINITALTLKNGQFMSRLLAFLSKNRNLAERLVFEIRQEEFHDLSIPVLQIISGLGKLGCSFSLDHVQSLDEDIGDLQRFRVRFLKVDTSMLADAIKDERHYKAIMKSKRLLEGNGIGLIAENKKTESNHLKCGFPFRKIGDRQLHIVWP